MKICVVIVTYSHRFNLLKQVIDAAIGEGAYKVIVIDNASKSESRNQLRDLERKRQEKLKVIYLAGNIGSAGGYKKGLQAANNCKDCEFIWLLDDDNKPEKGALKALIDFWNNLDEDNKEEKIALCCYRRDRNEYLAAIEKKCSWIIIGRKNSFLGFHILDLPYKILKRYYKVKLQNSSHVGTIPVAPYGGLFFNKEILDRIGFPDDKSFFVGMDDFDFTIRIAKSGGKIFLIPYSQIEDLETSWQIKILKQSKLSVPIIDSDNEQRVEQSIKSSLLFYRRHMLDSRPWYGFNKFCYLFLLFLYSLFKRRIKKFFKIYNIIEKYDNRDGVS